MNLFDLNSDNTVVNIGGKDIEMKHPICFGKVYDKWLVSECGKVWSLTNNKLIKGSLVNNVISVSQTDFIMLTDKIIRRKIKDKILISLYS